MNHILLKEIVIHLQLKSQAYISLTNCKKKYLCIFICEWAIVIINRKTKLKKYFSFQCNACITKQFSKDKQSKPISFF